MPRTIDIPPARMQRICSKCRKEKPLEPGFPLDRRGRLGYGPRCKDCVRKINRAAARERLLRDPEARARHKRFITVKHKYGLTREEYEALEERSGGRCEICRGTMNPPNVDHCHETGKVRGLLCTNCNHAIGRFADSVERLQAAIDYLATNG